MSDLFGRKQTLLTALLIFTAFSGGSGGAQTMIQLFVQAHLAHLAHLAHRSCQLLIIPRSIIFRVLQGLGGSGIFSISMVMLYELVPKEKYPKYTSAVMIMYALSLVLGPIVGGAISLRTTWRWVFLIK